MKIARLCKQAGLFLAAMVAVCGIAYTLLVTGAAQVLFPFQAHGSIVQGNDGRAYSLLIGQAFTDDSHMWGRVQSYDVDTFSNDEGVPLAWSAPSNANPASEEYAEQIAERVEAVRLAHPEQGDAPVPSDLVTCSGSGFDPEISPKAAVYQVDRLARTTGRSAQEIRNIIDDCTEAPLLGVFGEARVNVVKVNLMLDGIID